MSARRAIFSICLALALLTPSTLSASSTPIELSRQLVAKSMLLEKQLSTLSGQIASLQSQIDGLSTLNSEQLIELRQQKRTLLEQQSQLEKQQGQLEQQSRRAETFESSVLDLTSLLDEERTAADRSRRWSFIKGAGVGAGVALIVGSVLILTR